MHLNHLNVLICYEFAALLQVRILPLHMLERSNRRQMHELFKLLRKNGQVLAGGIQKSWLWSTNLLANHEI